jgi:hypothetical protein
MLREELQRLTEEQDVHNHGSLLQRLSEKFPNSIRIETSHSPIKRYTCLMHVLEFTEDTSYIAIAEFGLRQTYAGRDFAHWMFDQGHLEVVHSFGKRPNDFVFYFTDDVFRHVGILTANDRVLSKWGLGQLYNHGLWDVPASYGNEVRFTRPIPHSRASMLFRAFATARGVPEDL